MTKEQRKWRIKTNIFRSEKFKYKKLTNLEHGILRGSIIVLRDPVGLGECSVALEATRGYLRDLKLNFWVQNGHNWSGGSECSGAP